MRLIARGFTSIRPCPCAPDRPIVMRLIARRYPQIRMRERCGRLHARRIAQQDCPGLRLIARAIVRQRIEFQRFGKNPSALTTTGKALELVARMVMGQMRPMNEADDLVPFPVAI